MSESGDPYVVIIQELAKGVHGDYAWVTCHEHSRRRFDGAATMSLKPPVYKDESPAKTNILMITDLRYHQTPTGPRLAAYDARLMRPGDKRLLQRELACAEGG